METNQERRNLATDLAIVQEVAPGIFVIKVTFKLDAQQMVLTSRRLLDRNKAEHLANDINHMGWWWELKTPLEGGESD